MLNTAFLESQSKAGAGGIVRKGNEDMVMAFAKSVQFLTNNFSEADAALFGITWCCENLCNNCILELDSMLLVHLIQGKAQGRM